MQSIFSTGFISKNRKIKQRKQVILWLFILALVPILYFTYVFLTGEKIVSGEIFNPFLSSLSLKNQSSDENTFKERDSLEKVVSEILKGAEGTYGLVINNLRTRESYSFNEHKVFDTASLYKIWVMATVYKQIQASQLKEDQILSENVKTLNQKFEIAEEDAEEKEGVITLNVENALNQMITISDNYAALLLSSKVSLSTVDTFLKENELTESTVGLTGGAPTATPYDIALFLKKLYKGELANQQYTNEMMNLLKDQQLNGGLPKYLPDGSIVAHKTGELGLFKHDAGIVFTDTGDYIIVVLSETNNPAEAQEKIAQISKSIYDYFSPK